MQLLRVPRLFFVHYLVFRTRHNVNGFRDWLVESATRPEAAAGMAVEHL